MYYIAGGLGEEESRSEEKVKAPYSLQGNGRQSPRVEPFKQGDRPLEAEENPPPASPNPILFHFTTLFSRALAYSSLYSCSLNFSLLILLSSFASSLLFSCVPNLNLNSTINIRDALSQSSHCLHIMHIFQYLSLYQHKIYHSHNFHSISTYSHSSVFGVILLCLNKLTQSILEQKSVILPFSVSPQNKIYILLYSISK